MDESFNQKRRQNPIYIYITPYGRVNNPMGEPYNPLREQIQNLSHKLSSLKRLMIQSRSLTTACLLSVFVLTNFGSDCLVLSSQCAFQPVKEFPSGWELILRKHLAVRADFALLVCCFLMVRKSKSHMIKNYIGLAVAGLLSKSF